MTIGNFLKGVIGAALTLVIFFAGLEGGFLIGEQTGRTEMLFSMMAAQAMQGGGDGPATGASK